MTPLCVYRVWSFAMKTPAPRSFSVGVNVASMTLAPLIPAEIRLAAARRLAGARKGALTKAGRRWEKQVA